MFPKRWLKQQILQGLLIAFLFNSIGPLPFARANEFTLPMPGVMVHLSPPMNPPMLKGIKVDLKDPFKFEFVMDQGDSHLDAKGSDKKSYPERSEGSLKKDPSSHKNVPQDDIALKQEANRLIKYFLASITVPEKDLWVNLSPYEKDRIIPNSFGLTEMGRDLLAEDYMLKQITASLIYPEDEVGKKFWKRIYEESAKKYGTTNIPVNTFNKVWIVPEKAVVYENAKAGTAYVVESKLKVMLEEDYLAVEKNQMPTRGHVSNQTNRNVSPSSLPSDPVLSAKATQGNNVIALGSQIIRQIVIPELTREINEGANFAKLRQVYNSLILATWYKKKIKDSILSKVYADQNKVQGVGYETSVILSTVKDKKMQRISHPEQSEGSVFKDSSSQPKSLADSQNDVERIYQRYLSAFKKGVYNYIKEEIDPVTQQAIPRKYLSGGFSMRVDSVMSITEQLPLISKFNDLAIVSVKVDQAMSINQIIDPLTYDANKEKVIPPSKLNLPTEISLDDKGELYLRLELIKRTFQPAQVVINYLDRVNILKEPFGRLVLQWDQRTYSWRPKPGVEHRIKERVYRQKGLGTQAYLKLIKYFGVLASSGIESMSDPAKKMWERLGAKKEHFGEDKFYPNENGYAYVLRESAMLIDISKGNPSKSNFYDVRARIKTAPLFVNTEDRESFAGNGQMANKATKNPVALATLAGDIAFNFKPRIQISDVLAYQQVPSGIEYTLPEDINVAEAQELIGAIKGLPVGKNTLSQVIINSIAGWDPPPQLPLEQQIEILTDQTGNIETQAQLVISKSIKGVRIQLDGLLYWRGVQLLSQELGEGKINIQQLKQDIDKSRLSKEVKEAQLSAIRKIVGVIHKLGGWNKETIQDTSPQQERLTREMNCALRSAVVAYQIQELGIKVWSIDTKEHVSLLVQLKDDSYWVVEPSNLEEIDISSINTPIEGDIGNSGKVHFFEKYGSNGKIYPWHKGIMSIFYLHQGNALIRIEKFEEALEIYKKASILMPTNAIVYFNIGIALKFLKKDEEAIINFRKAIDLGDQDAEVYIFLGSTLQNLKRYNEAIDVFNKVIKLNQQVGKGYEYLGWVFVELQQYEKAKEAFEQALKFGQNNSFLLLSLGAVLTKIEKFEEAIVILNKAVVLGRFEAYEILIKVYQRLGRVKEAQLAQEEFDKKRKLSSKFQHDLTPRNSTGVNVAGDQAMQVRLAPSVTTLDGPFQLDISKKDLLLKIEEESNKVKIAMETLMNAKSVVVNMYVYLLGQGGQVGRALVMAEDMIAATPSVRVNIYINSKQYPNNIDFSSNNSRIKIHLLPHEYDENAQMHLFFDRESQLSMKRPNIKDGELAYTIDHPRDSFKMNKFAMSLDRGLYAKKKVKDGWSLEELKNKRQEWIVKNLTKEQSDSLRNISENSWDPLTSIWTSGYFLDKRKFFLFMEEIKKAVSQNKIPFHSLGNQILMNLVPNEGVQLFHLGDILDNLLKSGITVIDQDGAVFRDPNVSSVPLTVILHRQIAHTQFRLLYSQLNGTVSKSNQGEFFIEFPVLVTGNASWFESISSGNIVVHDGNDRGSGHKWEEIELAQQRVAMLGVQKERLNPFEDLESYTQYSRQFSEAMFHFNVTDSLLIMLANLVQSNQRSASSNVNHTLTGNGVLHSTKRKKPNRAEQWDKFIGPTEQSEFFGKTIEIPFEKQYVFYSQHTQGGQLSELIRLPGEKIGKLRSSGLGLKTKYARCIAKTFDQHGQVIGFRLQALHFRDGVVTSEWKLIEGKWGVKPKKPGGNKLPKDYLDAWDKFIGPTNNANFLGKSVILGDQRQFDMDKFCISNTRLFGESLILPGERKGSSRSTGLGGKYIEAIRCVRITYNKEGQVIGFKIQGKDSNLNKIVEADWGVVNGKWQVVYSTNPRVSRLRKGPHDSKKSEIKGINGRVPIDFAMSILWKDFIKSTQDNTKFGQTIELIGNQQFNLDKYITNRGQLSKVIVLPEESVGKYRSAGLGVKIGHVRCIAITYDNQGNVVGFRLQANHEKHGEVNAEWKLIEGQWGVSPRKGGGNLLPDFYLKLWKEFTAPTQNKNLWGQSINLVQEKQFLMDKFYISKTGVFGESLILPGETKGFNRSTGLGGKYIEDIRCIRISYDKVGQFIGFRIEGKSSKLNKIFESDWGVVNGKWQVVYSTNPRIQKNIYYQSKMGFTPEVSKGGVDFTANKTPLEIKNLGEDIKFNVDAAMMQKLQNAPGFYPVIMNITPLEDLKTFLTTK